LRFFGISGGARVFVYQAAQDGPSVDRSAVEVGDREVAAVVFTVGDAPLNSRYDGASSGLRAYGIAAPAQRKRLQSSISREGPSNVDGVVTQRGIDRAGIDDPRESIRGQTHRTANGLVDNRRSIQNPDNDWS
jgi:hypothetical protein